MPSNISPASATELTLRLDIQYFSHKEGFHNERKLHLKPFLQWMHQFIANTKLTFKFKVEEDTLNAYDGIVSHTDPANCLFLMREYDYGNDEHDLTKVKSGSQGFESAIVHTNTFLELYKVLNQFKVLVHADCELVFMKKCNELFGDSISLSIRSDRCIVIVV